MRDILNRWRGQGWLMLGLDGNGSVSNINVNSVTQVLRVVGWHRLVSV